MNALREKSIQTTKDKQTVEIDLDDKIELERREAYIEPNARILLRELLQNGDNSELVPEYAPGYGYVYQTKLGKTSGETAEGESISKDLLENLASLDIIHKSFYDTVSACPHCNSTIITLHNKCPSCSSHNVEKTNLTEHILCGYIDQRDKYISDRCPKCGEKLVNGQFRNMGRWFICKQCGDRFENPEFDVACRKCGKVFAIKEAQVTDIPKYSLNLNRKKETIQNIASLENVRNLLGDLGFQVETPGLITGQKSGIQHHFSLIAKKLVDNHEVIVALDHAVSESEVTASPLILYIYKTSEVTVDVPIFIAVPGLSENARKVAVGHNIMLIEGSMDEKEIMQRIKTEVANRTHSTTHNSIAVQVNEEKAETSIFKKIMGLRK
jgi:ssDNA-binding Zn-finger/Zn-ribbon topoisomerase 1